MSSQHKAIYNRVTEPSFLRIGSLNDWNKWGYNTSSSARSCDVRKGLSVLRAVKHVWTSALKHFHKSWQCQCFLWTKKVLCIWPAMSEILIWKTKKRHTNKCKSWKISLTLMFSLESFVPTIGFCWVLQRATMRSVFVLKWVFNWFMEVPNSRESSEERFSRIKMLNSQISPCTATFPARLNCPQIICV